MAVFLDANVLFSSSNAGSALHRLLHWVKDKEHLVTSAYAATEAARNIALKRPAWQPTHRTLMPSIAIVAEAPLLLDVRLPDKDKPILGSAIAARCGYLVTGDKRDFGHLYGSTIAGVHIISVLDFAKAMVDKHA